MGMNDNDVPGKQASPQGRDLSGKYLTFFLGKEEYGTEIQRVQEIIGMLPITAVPRTPDFIRGVINLRGKVISVVDLRLKFGMAYQDETDQTCVIVVRVSGVEIGVVVDKVSEVMNIPAKDIEPPPSFGADVDTSYILGIGKSQGKVKILMDVERVLSHGDLADLQSAASAA
jgi:purine-binding chemotaxis protein CheW